jgi:hypothetical protein
MPTGVNADEFLPFVSNSSQPNPRCKSYAATDPSERESLKQFLDCPPKKKPWWIPQFYTDENGECRFGWIFEF